MGGGTVSHTGDEKLRRSIARLASRAQRRDPAPPLKPEPSNAFEVAVAERLEYLQEQLDQLSTRLWWVLTVIVGAALVNVVLGLLQ